jgi:hypothetical protein
MADAIDIKEKYFAREKSAINILRNPTLHNKPGHGVSFALVKLSANESPSP